MTAVLIGLAVVLFVALVLVGTGLVDEQGSRHRAELARRRKISAVVVAMAAEDALWQLRPVVEADLPPLAPVRTGGPRFGITATERAVRERRTVVVIPSQPLTVRAPCHSAGVQSGGGQVQPPAGASVLPDLATAGHHPKHRRAA